MNSTDSLNLLRTHSTHKDFISLVSLLDKELAERDGDDHTYYAQFNKIDAIQHVIIAYLNNIAVGCGAIKFHSPGVMEIKRMYTITPARKQGIAKEILKALELWAYELNYNKCILETGKKQPEAIKLYEFANYQVIENYGQYAGVENSICFEKNLRFLIS